MSTLLYKSHCSTALRPHILVEPLLKVAPEIKTH